MSRAAEPMVAKPGHAHDANDSSSWVVLCDFDGTVSTDDVTDLLLGRFARSGWQELEVRWVDGEIGSRQCMEGQVALLDMSFAELDAMLAEVRIDPGFARFVDAVRARGGSITITSDRLDAVIQAILRRHGLGDLPVIANRLVQTGERSWRLQCPHADSACVRASGHCKCASARAQRGDAKLLYVGDGASDFCVAHRADFVLAKGSLADYAQVNAIAHAPIAGFDDALAAWAGLVGGCTDGSRVAAIADRSAA